MAVMVLMVLTDGGLVKVRLLLLLLLELEQNSFIDKQTAAVVVNRQQQVSK